MLVNLINFSLGLLENLQFFVILAYYLVKSRIFKWFGKTIKREKWLARLLKSSFYSLIKKIANKQVILLITGISAYYIELNFFKKNFQQGLTNRKINFFSTNTTFVCQPLHQSIIKVWKAKYRKNWIQFSCNKYE